VPEVRWVREDAILLLDADEPGPVDWPDVKHKVYLGAKYGRGEVWLIDGNIILIYRKRETPQTKE